MDRLIYTAMAGAKRAFVRQETIAQNIANVSTPGFKSSKAVSFAVPVSPDAKTRISVMEATPSVDFSQGASLLTGVQTDVAINGKGWLAVETARGEAYTRSGNLSLGAGGIVRTGSGHQVVGESGILSVPPETSVSIGSDGTVSTYDGTNTVDVGRLKLVSPDERDLIRGDDGLFRLRSGGVAEQDDSVSLVSGVLEGSNADPVRSLVEMVESSRLFEMHLKMLRLADDNAEKANKLLSMG